MDFTTLARLRDKLTIKHHLPGRIRIKFSVALLTDPQVIAIAKNPPPMPEGVLNADLNLFSRSLLLEYDPQRIDPDQLTRLLETDDDREAARIAAALLHPSA